MSSLRLEACCKINLCLEVLGPRSDGYHDLTTVFQAVSLADEVSVETRDERGITLDVVGGGAPPGRGNLCWQAAKAYRRERKWPEGAHIELVKRVPSGAGLGGGSSDAAAVLRALALMDPEPLRLADARRMAIELGSDVPFFLRGGTSIAYERGDDVRQLLDLAPCGIVLVKPDFEIATADAYGMLSEADFTDGFRTAEMATAIDDSQDIAAVSELVYSAFARPLTERWPVLGELKQRLLDAGALAAEVSGSGSARFGLFEQPKHAERAVTELARAGFWARAAEPAGMAGEPIERTE